MEIKNWKSIGITIAALTFLVGVTLPGFSFADVSDNPLDQISSQVKVVDYSVKKPWGDLSEELARKVSTVTFSDIEKVIKKNKIEGLADLKAYREQSTESEAAFLSAIETAVGSTENRDRVITAMQSFGEAQINAIILEGANFVRNLLATLAIIFIVVSGIRMATASGDETIVKEQGKAILWALAGLALTLLAEQLVTVIYGVPGAVRTDLLTNLPTGIGEEVAGIIRYVKALIGAIAIFMIILSGIRIIFTTEEEKKTKLYGGILWVAVGLIVIIVNEAVINNLYINPVQQGLQPIINNLPAGIDISDEKLGLSEVSRTIEIIGTVIKFGLGFVGLIAFALLVYAGATMALNFGNEEVVTNARKIAVNALIGIIIIISSFAIISTVIL